MLTVSFLRIWTTGRIVQHKHTPVISVEWAPDTESYKKKKKKNQPSLILCQLPCETTSWPAPSSPSARTQRSAAGSAQWPPPHSVLPAAPPAGSEYPLQRSAQECPSATWERREWPAGGSGSVGRGRPGCRCPDGRRSHRAISLYKFNFHLAIKFYFNVYFEL